MSNDSKEDPKKEKGPATAVNKAATTATPADKKPAPDGGSKPDPSAKPAEAPKSPSASKSPASEPIAAKPEPADEGGPGLWKGATLALFVIAGLAVVGALDYRSDLSKAQGDMAKLQVQVASERKAMQAEQEKFKKESTDIAAAVAAAKETLAATQADIEKRRTEAGELEGKLAGLYTETKAALDAASEAANKHAAAQAALDKLVAEHGKLNAKVTTARKELGKLENEAESMLKGLKGALGRIRGALDKL